MAYAVVTSLMTTLEQVLQFNPCLISESKLLIDSLYGRLSSLQAFLEDAGKRINDQEALTILEKKIRDAVYKAEDTVDLCLKRIHVADIDSNQDNARRMLYDELQQIGKVMDSIQEELMKFKNENQHIKDLPAINFFPLRSSGHVVDEENAFVGMENVFNKVLNQLIGGNARELNVVSVVGMGGIGKSTLAGSIFRNTSVFYHFDVSSWVTVSQEYDVREMLLDVLSFGTPSLKAMYSNLSNDQLLEQVYRKLKGKRYLIVLDDIWSIEAWNLVIRSFPDDENGSRIMLTTRLSEVAISAGNGYTFNMPFLNLENSWKLLADKVFGIAGCPLRLESMGKQIAQQCQGLPLSLIVIAGLLPKISRTYKDWKKVLESMKSHEGSTSEQCLAILALSYNYLPCSLKACFLYMGAFPEDEEIPVDKLIKIWVAEGFLKPSSHKKLEEVAEECLEDLVSRSLIIVSRRRANGKIRSCRIHDLLRQLCLREGKSDKFFHVITKSFEMSAEGMEIEHRLCLHPDGLENLSLGLEKGNFDSVRTILCLGELHSCFNSGCYKIVDPRFELLRLQKMN
nr:putative disease resistance protein At1g50180 [Nicotiana tomentosiformis]